MTVESVDTNVLIYAHDGGAGRKHVAAVELLSRLGGERSAALSIQVLAEFYSAAVQKLKMKPRGRQSLRFSDGTQSVRVRLAYGRGFRAVMASSVYSISPSQYPTSTS